MLRGLGARPARDGSESISGPVPSLEGVIAHLQLPPPPHTEPELVRAEAGVCRDRDGSRCQLSSDRIPRASKAHTAYKALSPIM